MYSRPKRKFYAYSGLYELGKEPCGSDGRMLFELKTTLGAVNRCARVFKDKPFMLYTYTNFYDNKTFRLVYRENIGGIR